MADVQTLCFSGCHLPNDESMIRCDLCQSWYHKECASKKDPDLGNIYAKSKKVKVPYWHCWVCSINWSRMVAFDSTKFEQDLNDRLNNLVAHFEVEKDALMTIIRERESEILALKDLLLQFRILTQQKYGFLNENENVLPADFNTGYNQSYIPTMVSESAPVSLPPDGLCDNQANVAQNDIISVKETNRDVNVSKNQINTFLLPDGKDVLIIGSNLLRNTPKYIKMKNAYVAMRPGAKVQTIITEVERQPVNHNAKVVIVQIGGNDIAVDPSPDYIIGDIWYLVELLKLKFPTSRIVVNAIIRKKGVSINLIKRLNQGIHWMCQKLNISFADPNPFIKNNCFARDGVHLNDLGVKTFSDFLKNSLSLVRDLTNT